MTRSELADELRQYQYELGAVPKLYIDILPDDFIIKSYVTCHWCGEKLLEDHERNDAIRTARTADEFLCFVSVVADSDDEEW